jgi:hypothetical protein
MFGERRSFKESFIFRKNYFWSFSILYSVFWPTVWHPGCLQILADRESRVGKRKMMIKEKN